MKRTSKITLVFASCFLSVLFLCSTVSFAKTVPKKLVLNHKNLTLYEGETETLQVVSVKPKKASKKVIWKSKKPGVVSVSSKGKVIAKKEGETVIKAISKKNPKVFKSIKITVKKIPQKIEIDQKVEIDQKAEKEFAVNGGMYKFSDSSLMEWKNTLYGLDSYREKGYVVISSKEAFQVLAGGVLVLSPYAETDFETDSLVLIECSLFRACEEKISKFASKFDASGKLCGQVTVQYKRQEDEPGVSYPDVMDDYVIVLRLSKEDAAMIDYFECKIEKM